MYWLRRTRRSCAPAHRVDARVVGINVSARNIVRVHVVAIDVIRVHVIRADIIPIDVVHICVIHVHVIPIDVVYVHVVVINVSIDSVVVGDVVVIHIPIHHCCVDVDGAVPVIHVHAVDVHVMRAGRYPSRSMPTMVIDGMRVPVAVVVKPRTNRQSNTKRDRRSGNYRPSGRGRRLNVDNLWVVGGNVDHLRLSRYYLDDLLLHNNYLLWCRGKVACCLGSSSQSLD